MRGRGAAPAPRTRDNPLTRTDVFLPPALPRPARLLAAGVAAAAVLHIVTMLATVAPEELSDTQPSADVILQLEAEPAGKVATAPAASVDRYYRPDELDVKAKPANDVALVYPKAAYAMRLKGRVRARLYIDENGRLQTVDILEAEPPGVFERSALDAITALRFHPALRHGERVKSQKTIEVVFDPYERINVP